MNTDYTALTDYHQSERELDARLERRRIAAKRAAAEFGGDRLALAAHRARAARAAKLADPGPVAC